MKRKWLISLLLPLPVLFILFITARLTGVFQIYRCPTPSGEPTLKVGQIFFTSNLKTPEKGNIIVFTSSRYHDSVAMMGTKGLSYVYRLIAEQGDILEMKEGICFVNGKNVDTNKNLMQNYIAGHEIYKHLTKIEELEAKGYLRALSDTLLEVFLTTKEAAVMREKGVKTDKVVYKSKEGIMGEFKWMKKDSAWTIDNFGPLKIPKDCFFVLGDNRHNALDSRFVGFIKKENYKGSVLGIN